jgi:hypothetical protein
MVGEKSTGSYYYDELSSEGEIEVLVLPIPGEGTKIGCF